MIVLRNKEFSKKKVIKKLGSKEGRDALKKLFGKKFKNVQQSIIEAQPANITRRVGHAVARNPVNSVVKGGGTMLTLPGPGEAIAESVAQGVFHAPFGVGSLTSYAVGPGMVYAADKGKQLLYNLTPKFLRNASTRYNNYVDTRRLWVENPQARTVGQMYAGVKNTMGSIMSLPGQAIDRVSGYVRNLNPLNGYSPVLTY